MKLSTFIKIAMIALFVAFFSPGASAQNGAEVHTLYGPALPPTCNPLSDSQPLVYYLNTVQGANPIGLYSCVGPNQWAQSSGGNGNATSIQGIPVSSTGPALGQCLISPDGLTWAPGSCSGSSNFGFNQIQSGINTSAAMGLGNGSSLTGTGTATEDFSGQSGANSHRIPNLSGIFPTSPGAIAFNSSSATYVGGIGGSTVTFNTSAASVSSVGLTLPSWLSVSPATITSSGIFAVTPAVSQTSHQVIGTCGSATTFTPCSLVPGDIPTLNQNTTGTAASLSAILSPTLGGSGLGTATAHGVLFGEGTSPFGVSSPGTTGQCLISNGSSTDPSFQNCSGSFSSPMTTFGDMLYENATPTAARLAGNTSTNMAGLTQTGNGTISAAPVWTAFVGGGTNPVAATVSTVAAGQILVYNTSGILVNNYPGVSVNPQTGAYGMTCSTDRLGEIDFNVAGATTLTVPQAGASACLGSNIAFVVRNAISSTAVVTVTPTISTFQPENAASKTILPGAAMFVYSDATTSTGNYHAIDIPANYGGVSVKTTSYTATAADRNKLIVMNCTAACVLTLPAAPPSINWTISAESIGTTTATVSLNSLTFNGTSTPPVLAATALSTFSTDGSNYFGNASTAAPVSATVLASNGSGQVIAAPLTSAQIWVGNGSNLPVAVTLTGDATLANTGSLTLATTGVTAGSCGDTTHSCSLTIDAKGRITAQSNNSITGGGGGSGDSDSPFTSSTRYDQIGVSITAPVTVANTVTATSLVGNSFVGRKTIPAGQMIAGSNGAKVIHIVATGTVSTASTNFGLTGIVSIGGVTVGSITAPTIASLSSAGWTATFDITVNSPTSVNAGGCFTITGTASAALQGCASSGNVTGLDFTSDQNLDFTVTWGTASASNSITVNELVATPIYTL